MILDHVTLHNVGLYAGSNRFNFQTEGDHAPVVLIGGLNGAGKTTLLEALLLGLYGPESPGLPRGLPAYRAHLEELIHRGIDPEEGAYIEIAFRRFQMGREESILLRRSWNAAASDVVERLEILRDQVPDPVLASHWSETMAGYLPARIARLFFFDGEQIKEMAEEEGTGEILSSALHCLLGLDSIEQLEADLKILERRKRSQNLKHESRQALDGLEKDLKTAQEHSERQAQEAARLRTECDRLRKKLVETEAEFRKQGGDTHLRRAELEAQRSDLEGQVFGLEEELREIAAGPAPLLLVLPLLGKLEAQATQELDHKKRTALSEAEAERDQRILSDLDKSGIDSSVRKQVEGLLANHRTPRPESVSSHLPGLTEELPHHLSHLRKKVLPSTRERIEEVLNKLHVSREQLARVTRSLEAAPDQEAIADLVARINARRQEIQSAEARLQIAEQAAGQAFASAAQLEKQHQKFLLDEIDEMTVIEDTQRILVHSPRVRATLEEFRRRIVQKYAAKFESLILESFQQLLRKTSLVHSIQIDPATMRLRLLGPDLKELPFRRLSAGERQLLATAMLWGLARASGRPVPVVIDTPLARLDSKHRHFLVERYFPHASHQVILLSTDEEITSRYHKLLDPFISKTYHLLYDNKLKRTSVQEDYFSQYETAS